MAARLRAIWDNLLKSTAIILKYVCTPASVGGNCCLSGLGPGVMPLIINVFALLLDIEIYNNMLSANPDELTPLCKCQKEGFDFDFTQNLL